MKKLTEGNIYKTFILYSFPLVLSAILSTAYGTVDTIIAGQYLGDRGLAATGATAPLLSMLSSLFWGYGVGYSMYIARLFGAGAYGKMRRAICTNFFCAGGISLLFSVLSILFREPIFDFLNITDPSLRREAAKYFMIYMAGFPIMILNSNCIFSFNVLGMTAFPFAMSALSAALNIGGNILTIKVFRMGVDGLAVATVFSAAVVTASYLLRLRASFRELDYDRKEKMLGKDVVKEGFPFSLPSTVQQMALYFATFFLSPMVNAISLTAPAAYVVVSRIYEIHATVYQNSSNVLSAYTSQCVGEGHPEKVGKGIVPTIIQGYLFLAPILCVFLIFPRFTASLFFKADAAPETVGMTLDFIRYFLPFVVLNLINNLFHNLYRGLKKMNLLMFSTIFNTVVRITVSAILTPKIGMNGFYIGWAASWAAEALACLVIFLSPRLLPPEVKKLSGHRKFS